MLGLEESLFEYLAEFDQIIVTGPHRAGTTIALEMMATDLSYQSVREEAFDFYDEVALFGLLDEQHDSVFQCPALFDLMPKLSSDSRAIVMMYRPLWELWASRNRMYSTEGKRVQAKVQNDRQLERLGVAEGDAAQIKYERWEEWKADGMIHHPFDLEYSSLAAHPLWVPEEDRRQEGKAWHHRRTGL